MKKISTLLVTALANSAPSVFTISGTVYDADGSTAVASATVALGAYSATSAANGTYTISDVPAGTSGSMTCTKTGYSWAAKTIAAMSGNLTSQNYSNAWWAAGGCAAACVGAYQAYGAASQAASYVNLANPGTNDLTTSAAPAWNTAIGWTFNGSSQYLLTGFAPADTNVSALVCHAGAASQTGNPFGASDAVSKAMMIALSQNNDDTVDFWNGPYKRVTVTDGFRFGVMGIVGKHVYNNGSAIDTIGAGTLTAGINYYIGAVNNNGTPGNYYNKSIESIVFYNAEITAGQAAAVSAAMAAINP